MPLKLNIGCGSNKINGYINIDTEESCKPDLVHNILDGPLPYEDGSVDEIAFFHCIEHVRKCYHELILREFRRVLKVGARLYISYPHFLCCVEQWKQATGEKKRFFEYTIYGRQLYPSDYHVAIMDPDELTETLTKVGYKNIIHTPELCESYNYITAAIKSEHCATAYEDVVKQGLTHTVIIKEDSV